MGRVRKPRPLWPYQPDRAERLFESLEGGWTLADAMARACISERCIFAWLRHSTRRAGGPELEPYVRFAARFRRLVGDAMGMATRLDGE